MIPSARSPSYVLGEEEGSTMGTKVGDLVAGLDLLLEKLLLYGLRANSQSQRKNQWDRKGVQDRAKMDRKRICLRLSRHRTG